MTAPPDAILATDVFSLYRIPDGPTVAALRGLSLRVAEGERLVVRGPNGSGKTTLLRMLSGELAPSSGELVVAGQDLSRFDERSATRLRRDRLGVISQNSGRALRPELDVLDNIALQLQVAGLPRRAARTAATALLHELDLGALAPRRTQTLSGGEAQRIAICAAIAHRPAVLLADEPTGELDPDSADLVYDLIAASARRVGATLVLVTHDARASRIADRVARIRDGRLSEQWHPDRPDPAGWLRLPETLRARAGARTTVRVRERDGDLVLHGTDAPQRRVAARTSPPGPLPVDDAPAELARLRGVTIAFAGRAVLTAFDLTVLPGTFTAIRGRSGSGKSTLLRLLLGLADPDDGEVELAGRPLRGLSRAARADVRRAWTGVSTQSGALVETADARDNLLIARRARGLQIVGPDAVTVVDAAVDALGLAVLTGRPARLLSGGERQRVALARSLVAQRALVVLDEPTSQQDEVQAGRTADTLAAAARAGAAVVVATHDDAVAAAADVVLDLA